MNTRCECGKIGVLVERLDARNLRPIRRVACTSCARRDGFVRVSYYRAPLNSELRVIA